MTLTRTRMRLCVFERLGRKRRGGAARSSGVRRLRPRTLGLIRILRNADLRKGDSRPRVRDTQSAYPELLNSPTPRVDRGNYIAAIDLALVLQKTGEFDKASALARSQ